MGARRRREDGREGGVNSKSEPDCAWVSAALMDSSKIRGFYVDIVEVDRDRGGEILRRVEDGRPVNPDELPKVMWAKGTADNTKRPDFFLPAGSWVVSGAVAKILKKHDLGSSQVTKVKLLKTNRKDPIEGEYYNLALSEFKDTLLPNASTALRTWPNQTWALSFEPTNDQVALATSCLTGPDLWREIQLPRAFFLSDRLTSALREAKLTRHFKLYRCRIVG